MYPRKLVCLNQEMVLDGPASTLITRVCMVCNKHLGYKDGEGSWGPSHTVCDSCMEEQMRMVKVTKAA